MRSLLGLLAALVALTVVAPSEAARGGGGKAKAKLTRFSDCGKLGKYARRHARKYAVAGRPTARTPVFAQPVMPPGAEGFPVAAPAPAADGSGGESFSTTNVQEAGVFEPDIVKTDGKLLYAITSSGVLKVTDVQGAPVLLGSVKLSDDYAYGHQLLLDGRKDRVLAMWTGYDRETGMDRSMLAQVDVADPAAPVIERTLGVDGSILSARRTGRTVRAVLALRPPALMRPVERRTTAPARAWLPRGRFANASGKTKRRKLLGCRSVRKPRGFSGLEQLTVLTINLDKSLDPVDSDAVMTGGETVYASADNLYVATQRYRPGLERRTDGPVPDRVTTLVHRFSLDDADNTTYRGSGTVPGFALNQFSLSEHENVLRVATTTTPVWFDRTGDPSQSYVTTLAAKDGRLEQLGQVGGLGKGEQIYAVRLFGDTGYVVTFRQIDPLYTIDLSDPREPRVLGELKIPGFSSYLHPIAGDRLIGVGTAGDDDGRTFGLQVSLFDVSDLAAPKLERKITFDSGSSEVAYDHHAFLWWAPLDLAVLPVDAYEGGGNGDEPVACAPEGPCSSVPYRPTSNAVGITVRPAGIVEAGRVSHGAGVQVRRSLVNQNRLLTVSDRGVMASSLDGWGELGFAEFGG